MRQSCCFFEVFVWHLCCLLVLERRAGTRRNVTDKGQSLRLKAKQARRRRIYCVIFFNAFFFWYLSPYTCVLVVYVMLRVCVCVGTGTSLDLNRPHTVHLCRFSLRLDVRFGQRDMMSSRGSTLMGMRVPGAVRQNNEALYTPCH